MKENQTYYQWLIGTRRNSPRGDLAYDVKNDRTFPIQADRLEEIIEHLKAKGACREALAAARTSWRDYQSYINQQKLKRGA